MGKNLVSGVVPILLSGLLLTSCSDPFIVIPGGQLAGQVSPAPDLWRNVPDTIQVESNPPDPYSINIWGVGIGSDLYIATSADGTTWSRYLENDPAVRVRIDNAIFELSAVLVTEPIERKRVLDAYVEKYDEDAGDSFVTDGLILRLDR